MNYCTILDEKILLQILIAQDKCDQRHMGEAIVLFREYFSFLLKPNRSYSVGEWIEMVFTKYDHPKVQILASMFYYAHRGEGAYMKNRKGSIAKPIQYALLEREFGTVINI